MCGLWTLGARWPLQPPRLWLAIGSVKGAGKGAGGIRSRDPGPQMLHSASTPAPGASSVVLPMSVMGNASGPRCCAGIDVLPRLIGRYRPTPWRLGVTRASRVVHSTPMSVHDGRPGVVCITVVRSTPRLGISCGRGVLCTIERTRSGPLSMPNAGPPPIGAAGAESARGPRVDGHEAWPSTPNEPSAKATPKRARECAPL